jgi:hypothetical protein
LVEGEEGDCGDNYEGSGKLEMNELTMIIPGLFFEHVKDHIQDIFRGDEERRWFRAVQNNPAGLWYMWTSIVDAVAGCEENWVWRGKSRRRPQW